MVYSSSPGSAGGVAALASLAVSGDGASSGGPSRVSGSTSIDGLLSLRRGPTLAGALGRTALGRRIRRQQQRRDPLAEHPPPPRGFAPLLLGAGVPRADRAAA